MTPVVQHLERLLVLPPVAPVSGEAGARGDALPSRASDGRVFAYRFVQNTSAATVNYAIDIDASAVAYHGQIPPGVQLAVPCLGRVSIFGAAAWSCAVMEMIRQNG